MEKSIEVLLSTITLAVFFMAVQLFLNLPLRKEAHEHDFFEADKQDGVTQVLTLFCACGEVRHVHGRHVQSGDDQE